jgi:hypothetical protein
MPEGSAVVGVGTLALTVGTRVVAVVLRARDYRRLDQLLDLRDRLGNSVRPELLIEAAFAMYEWQRRVAKREAIFTSQTNPKVVRLKWAAWISMTIYY